MKLGHLSFVVLLAVGCGGKIDDGDGGTSSNDASTTPDSPILFKDASVKADVIVTPPPGQCGNFNVDGTIGSDGSCQASASWTCGATSYAVQCSCPQATCSCSQQTGSSGSGTMVSGAQICGGSCSPTVAELGAICNFPTQ